MKKFKIESGVFEIFPDLQIGVLTFKGINNNAKGRKDLLKAAYNIFSERLEGLGVLHPNILDYKEAMKMIKKKKGSAASIEAMAKRVDKGIDMYSINPIVDLYNSVSLKHMITFGGEDLDKIKGDMVLGFAKGDEEFIALGEEKNSSPREGELVYKDDVGVVVRSWLWREADRTKLTNETSNALIYMELVNINRQEEFKEALKETERLVLSELGGICNSAILTKANPGCAL